MDKLRAAARSKPINDDVAVGLHTVSEFNQTIRYADTKAAALAAAQALTVTVLTSRRDLAGHSAGSAVLFALVVAGAVVSTAMLTAGQAPRLVTASGDRPNRLAFPTAAEMGRAELLATPTARGQSEDVWRQAGTLAAIAMTKYRWLHRATAATAVTVGLMLVWLCLTSWW
jgi:hypothetical protein